MEKTSRVMSLNFLQSKSLCHGRQNKKYTKPLLLFFLQTQTKFIIHLIYKDHNHYVFDFGLQIYD